MTIVDPRQIVLPSHDDDPIAARAGTAFGGPVGRHARLGASRFWTPLRVLLAFTFLTAGLAWAQKAACRDPFTWQHEHQYTRMCYSDVTALYYAEGLNSGKVPYVDHPVEYPVVIGAVMWTAASVAKSLPGVPQRHEAEAFFDLTALILAGCLMLVVVFTAKVARRRPWDAALVALAPALVIHAYTNWDLLAAAFTALAIHAWSRERLGMAGVWIALGTSSKLYPVLLLVPLLGLCVRSGRLRAWAVTAATTVGVFALVNVPVYLAASRFVFDSAGNAIPSPRGENAWVRFWSLNQHRAADWDSLWFMLQRDLDNGGGGQVLVVKLVFGLALVTLVAGLVWSLYGLIAQTVGVARKVVLAGTFVVVLGSVVEGYLQDGWALVHEVLGHAANTPFQLDPAGSSSPHRLNAAVFWGTLTLLLAVLALALSAPRRPRVGQLMFLLVAAFLLVNKVDSPQYVVWLIPLAALARPRWRAFLVWQVAELLVLVTRFYFFIGNDHPGQGIGYRGFGLAVVARDIALLVVMALVVREIYRPELDVVRRDDVDDPAGGVLDGATDELALAR